MFSSFHIICMVTLIILLVRVYYWFKSNVLAKQELKTKTNILDEVVEQNLKAAKDEKIVSSLTRDELRDSLSK